jgi:hypothetical protein
MPSKQTAAFLVLGGEVLGVDPMVVPVETAAGQCELLRTDELEGWYGIGGDGIARALHQPTRQHSRRALRHVRTAIVGQHIVPILQGRTP